MVLILMMRFLNLKKKMMKNKLSPKFLRENKLPNPLNPLKRLRLTIAKLPLLSLTMLLPNLKKRTGSQTTKKEVTSRKAVSTREVTSRKAVSTKVVISRKVASTKVVISRKVASTKVVTSRRVASTKVEMVSTKSHSIRNTEWINILYANLYKHYLCTSFLFS